MLLRALPVAREKRGQRGAGLRTYLFGRVQVFGDLAADVRPGVRCGALQALPFFGQEPACRLPCLAGLRRYRVPGSTDCLLDVLAELRRGFADIRPPIARVLGPLPYALAEAAEPLPERR